MNPKAMFGEYFKTKRIEKEMTLRDFCRKFGLDPGNLSKLERGLMPPPTAREKLEAYASYLGLAEGSDDWMEFFDRAAACRGQVPKDLLEDSEVIKSLPVIFRTIRGKKISTKRLNELIEMIKRA